MIKLLSMLCLSLASLSLGLAQTARVRMFPTIQLKTLTRKPLTVPKDLTQKVNIVILVFEQQAQLKVNTWASVIFKEFEPQASISYHELPMMSGWYAPMAWQIDNWMRDGIPQDYHANTATFYGDRSPLLRKLEITDRSDCYVYILDQTGRIRFQSQGNMTPEKEQAFRAAVQRLLKP
ncbi:MAG: hypothetical protein AAFR61_21435 [Bacteroidota bacterium]